MSIFTTELSSLLATFWSMATAAPQDAEAPLNLHPQSLEITIPVAWNQPDGALHAHLPTAMQMEVRTVQMLQELLLLDSVSKAARLRIQKCIADGCRNMQTLLREEGVDARQVLLDYVQTVLAVTQDAWRAQKAAQLRPPKRSFEELTEAMMTGLQDCIPRSKNPAAALLPTMLTDGLAHLPAHALTYVKLLFISPADDAQNKALTGT